MEFRAQNYQSDLKIVPTIVQKNTQIVCKLHLRKLNLFLAGHTDIKYQS